MAMKRNGFSLVEAAVIMGLVALVFIPMARMAGGFGQTSSVGKTATDATRNRMREVTAANSLMEEALLGNLQLPNLSLSTLSATTPYRTGVQSYSDYSRQVYYDWTLLNQSYAVDPQGNWQKDEKGALVPLVNGNSVAAATLRLYADGTTTTPTLVLPTTVSSRRINTNAEGPAQVGVMLVLDTSGSMAWSRNDHSLPNTTIPSDPNPLLVSAPYLKYRYEGNGALDLTKDAELDIVAALRWDSAATAFDETYIPGRSTLSNASANLKLKSGCVANAQNAPYFVSEAMSSASPVRKDYLGKPLKSLYSYVDELCKVSPTMNDTVWQDTVNNNLSRIEAARSALFVFLSRMENNPFLAQNMKLGFESYNSSGSAGAPINRVSVHAPLKSATNNKYKDIRTWVSYINRQMADGSTRIPVFGGTPTRAAVLEAAKKLYDDEGLTDRIIILMTDGVPTDDTNNGNGIAQLMNELGSGNAQGANGKRVTVLAVGLVGANKSKLDTWALQNRNGGADGESFFAANVVQTMRILDSVADKTISIALKSNTCRYNVKVTTTPCDPNG
jgi:hypothetical protein